MTQFLPRRERRPWVRDCCEQIETGHTSDVAAGGGGAKVPTTTISRKRRKKNTILDSLFCLSFYPRLSQNENLLYVSGNGVYLPDHTLWVRFPADHFRIFLK